MISKTMRVQYDVILSSGTSGLVGTWSCRHLYLEPGASIDEFVDSTVNINSNILLPLACQVPMACPSCASHITGGFGTDMCIPVSKNEPLQGQDL